MANQLKMAMVNAILTPKQRGWSQRHIARELGMTQFPQKISDANGFNALC
jgi:transcriptional regulator